MSESHEKPKFLRPWTCPKCGADCDAELGFKDGEESVGHYLECDCGCEFTYWESLTYAPYGVEVDGEMYPFEGDSNKADVSHFLEEYDGIGPKGGALADLPVDDIVNKLVKNHDWTEEGARILVDLAVRHGSFVLRNALALALALDIEDGSDGQ